MSVLNKPRIEVYVGQSGSGKGVSVKARLRELKPPRLLIWDPRDEYDGHAKKFDSLPALVGAFKSVGQNGVRARFVAGPKVKLEEAFAIVCQLAFATGNIVFLAEELSDVTKPSYAPPAWRQVLTQGRHRGLHVIGVAQRPALIDKTLLGMCTYARTFSMRYRADRKAMADALDCNPAMLEELRMPPESGPVVITYIERDFSRDGQAERGSLTLKRNG